ncbi:hypothetical protein EYB53_019055, partial [Candidatus Chloroploca sp. M-50]
NRADVYVRLRPLEFLLRHKLDTPQGFEVVLVTTQRYFTLSRPEGAKPLTLSANHTHPRM